MDTLTLLDFSVSALIILIGIFIVFSKDTIKAIIYLSILSMLSSVAFVLLKAPDVAVTEIVIGSGLITFLFLFTFKKKVGDTK